MQFPPSKYCHWRYKLKWLNLRIPNWMQIKSKTFLNTLSTKIDEFDRKNNNFFNTLSTKRDEFDRKKLTRWKIFKAPVGDLNALTLTAIAPMMLLLLRVLRVLRFEIVQRKTFNFLLHNFVVLLARWRDWDWLYRLLEEKYEKGFGRGGQFSKPSLSIPLILRCLAFVFGYFSFCPCYHLLCLCFYLRMTQFSLSLPICRLFLWLCVWKGIIMLCYIVSVFRVSVNFHFCLSVFLSLCLSMFLLSE